MKNRLISSIPFLNEYYLNRMQSPQNKCDFEDRTYELFFLDMFLRGKHYDFLKYPFNKQLIGDSRIPLSDRRPSIQYNIAKLIVDGSTSLLFSESHYPKLHCDHDNTREILKKIIKSIHTNEIMLDAAFKGSIGSVCLLVGVVGEEDEAELFCKVLKSIFITPYYQNDKSSKLSKVIERYKIRGIDLFKRGFKIKKDNFDDDFWFVREWNKEAEVYYYPERCDDDKIKYSLSTFDFNDDLGKIFKIDEKRTVYHNFGFVPIIWIKNLPGGNDVDGLCTFDQIINNSIEIDYLLSQGGRGLKYSSEPLLAITSNSGVDAEMFKDGNVLSMDADGNAKLLEISGGAISAVVDYVKFLREISIESLHGDKSDTNKLSVAQSGKAMELMHHTETLLADVLRAFYGERALLDLYKMILKILSKRNIYIEGKKISSEIAHDENLILVWGNWYSTTPDDLNKKAMAGATLKNSGLASTETIINSNSADYNVEDVNLEISKINKEQEVINDREQRTGTGENVGRSFGDAGKAGGKDKPGNTK